MINTVKTLTKKEEVRTRNTHNLNKFYSESLNAYVLDVDEAIEEMGHGFYTKLVRLAGELSNTKNVWKIDIFDDMGVYVMYKARRGE